jgi:hypothetical protein
MSASILAAERACERLVIRYAQLVDSGKAAGIADLFTKDGIWEGKARGLAWVPTLSAQRSHGFGKCPIR